MSKKEKTTRSLSVFIVFLLIISVFSVVSMGVGSPEYSVESEKTFLNDELGLANETNRSEVELYEYNDYLHVYNGYQRYNFNDEGTVEILDENNNTLAGYIRSDLEIANKDSWKDEATEFLGYSYENYTDEHNRTAYRVTMDWGDPSYDSDFKIIYNLEWYKATKIDYDYQFDADGEYRTNWHISDIQADEYEVKENRTIYDDGGLIIDWERSLTDIDNFTKEVTGQKTDVWFNMGEFEQGDTHYIDPSLSGSGTSDDPYEISNLTQLQEMEDDLDAHYELVNDIDASDTENWNQLIDEGDWQNDTEYKENDYVSNDGNNYYCAQDHTSDADSEPETGDDWTDYWLQAENSEAGDYLGFHPIGRYPFGDSPSNWEQFEGTLDGQGYEIKNLYIDRPDENTVGLFGLNRNDGTEVKNVGVVGADVSGNSRVGGLVGQNQNSATVSDSYSENADVSGDLRVGGLVGQNQNSATVSDSYSENADVSGDLRVGGLVGQNQDSATVSDSYSENADVSGDEKVGELVGQNQDSATVSDSYSENADVSGDEKVGELVGQNQDSATVSDSYSENADVSGDKYVGGLVGQNQNSATVSNSYATSSVDSSSTQTGGLIGRNYDVDGEESTIENCYSTVEIIDNGGGLIGSVDGDGTVDIVSCYWDSETSGTATGINEDDGSGTRDLEGLGTQRMKSYYTYGSDWDIDMNMVDKDTNQSYPYHGDSTWEIDVVNFSDGDGTSGSPYQVENLVQLQNMHNNLSSDYILIDDVDASETENWNDGKGFDPLGNDTERFTGTFDGNNYSISDLFIDRDDIVGLGMFSHVGEEGTIKNLDIKNLDVTGGDSSEHTGGLAGRSYGVMKNVYVSGYVEGWGDDLPSHGVGMITGTNSGFGYLYNCTTSGEVISNLERAGGVTGYSSNTDGKIEDCHSNATVTGAYRVGGLVGRSMGEVIDSSTSGLVKGVEQVGGLVGESKDPIRDSFSTSDIVAIKPDYSPDKIGGLVGENWNLINNSYATGDINGIDAEANQVGGFVGQSCASEDSDVGIYNSYATGEVSGMGRVGGFIGHLQGDIRKSYATGNVSGYYQVGGFAGQIIKGHLIADSYSVSDVTRSSGSSSEEIGGFIGRFSGGVINRSYSTGKVEYEDSSNPDDNGFVGYVSDEGNVTDSYWDIETSGQNESEYGEGKTTSEMKDYDTFKDDWDISVNWTDTHQGPSYPYQTDSETNWTIDQVKTYNLTINIDGKGEELNYGQGSHIIENGTEVTLEAEADPNFSFTKWTGDIESYSKIIEFDMDENKTQTAYFVKNPEIELHDPTNITDESATLNAEVAQMEDIDEGVVFFQYRIVGENWMSSSEETIYEPQKFDYDAENLSVNTEYEYKGIIEWDEDGTTTSKETNVETFETKDTLYNLTISSTTGGSVVEPGEDTYQYEDGTVVDLEAVAEEGYKFIEWTGDTNMVDNLSSNQTTITVDDDYSITANFEEEAYFEVTIFNTNSPVKEEENLTVEVQIDNIGGLSGTQSVELLDFDDVEVDSINVTLDAGESTTETLIWETVVGNGETTDDITVKSEDDIDIETATIEYIQYTLIWNIDGEGDVNINETWYSTDGSESFDRDTVIDINASSEDGWYWSDWSGDLETDTQDTNITMDSDKEITANFDQDAIFEVTIVDTNSPIVEDEDLNVEVKIENMGDLEGTQDIELLDFESDVQDSSNITLDGGEQTTVTLVWNTQEGIGETTDDITVQSEDTQDVETITIEEYVLFGTITQFISSIISLVVIVFVIKIIFKTFEGTDYDSGGRGSKGKY